MSLSTALIRNDWKTNFLVRPSLKVNVKSQLHVNGAIAQLGERLPCTQEVCGSIPHSSTIYTYHDDKHMHRLEMPKINEILSLAFLSPLFNNLES